MSCILVQFEQLSSSFCCRGKEGLGGRGGSGFKGGGNDGGEMCGGVDGDRGGVSVR